MVIFHNNFANPDIVADLSNAEVGEFIVYELEIYVANDVICNASLVMGLRRWQKWAEALLRLIGDELVLCNDGEYVANNEEILAATDWDRNFIFLRVLLDITLSLLASSVNCSDLCGFLPSYFPCYGTYRWFICIGYFIIIVGPGWLFMCLIAVILQTKHVGSIILWFGPGLSVYVYTHVCVYSGCMIFRLYILSTK